MKIKTYFFAGFMMSFFLISAAYAMNLDEIEFEGRKHSAIQLIKNAHANPEMYPFASTQIFVYTLKGLKMIGGLKELLPDDMTEIESGNFVYSSAIDASSPPIGAFILGTKDEGQIATLRALLRQRSDKK